MIATGLAWDVSGRLCRYVGRYVGRAANRLEDRLNPWCRRRMYRPGHAVRFDNLTDIDDIRAVHGIGVAGVVDDRGPP